MSDHKKTLHLLFSALIIFALFSLSACTGDGADDNTANNDNSAKSIMVSSDGVGPINASTPFNMHKITVAFPDYSVVEQSQFQKGAVSPIIRVSSRGRPLLIIYPDTQLKNIFSVVIKDNQIGNSLGHDIGFPYSKIYTYETREPCAPGVEELNGKVLCMAPNSPNMLYVFSGQWDGPTGQIPPVEVLANWNLEEIVWRPKS